MIRRMALRLTVLLLVAALHAALVVTLADRLGRRPAEAAHPLLVAAIIEEPAAAPPDAAAAHTVPEPAPEPPPVPAIGPPPLVELPPQPDSPQPPPVPTVAALPTPEIPVRRPTPRPATRPTPAARPAAPAPPAPAPTPAMPASLPPRAEPVRQAAVVDATRTCRLPQYPPLSRRNGEAGTVTLTFLIDTDGSMLESHIETSSGYERLDEAARQALALCRFRAGSVDGVPERSWARMRYVWTLN